jgi:hypothetical protein
MTLPSHPMPSESKAITRWPLLLSRAISTAKIFPFKDTLRYANREALPSWEVCRLIHQQNVVAQLEALYPGSTESLTSRGATTTRDDLTVTRDDTLAPRNKVGLVFQYRPNLGIQRIELMREFVGRHSLHPSRWPELSVR